MPRLLGACRQGFKSYLVILCVFYLLLVLVFHSQLQIRRLQGLDDEEEINVPAHQSFEDPLSFKPAIRASAVEHHLLRDSRHDIMNMNGGPGKVPVADIQLDEGDHNDLSSYVGNCSGSRTEGNKFIKLGPSRDIYVYSAYWDARPNDFDNKENATIIRIMAVIKIRTTPPLQCHFRTKGQEIIVEATYYEMCENHNMYYGGYILSCRIPYGYEEVPCSIEVSIRTVDDSSAVLPVWVLQPQPTQHDHAICVPPLFGEINERLLVEFIEVSLLLGVDKLVFYDFKMNRNIRNIIRYYSKRGDVSIVPWDLPSILDGQMWYHGQLVSVQDCLYRNMHSTKYVSFNDIDEFIVPHEKGGAHTWGPMLKALYSPDRCGYQFKSAYFDRPSEFVNESYSSFMTQSNLQRTKKVSSIRTKCMAQPYRIFETGIHHISKPILATLETVPVNADIGLLHHYRSCIGNYGMSCRSYVNDNSLQKFDKILYEKVKEVMKDIGGFVRNF